MHAGIHVIGWGLQRLMLAVGIALVAALLAYVSWVFVIVSVQAVSALGH
jgi:hypothetical protein